MTPTAERLAPRGGGRVVTISMNEQTMTRRGLVPAEEVSGLRGTRLDPSVMGPPSLWSASPDATGVRDGRMVARDSR